MFCHNCTGNVIEGPSNVTYFAGLTPLPIQLTCNVTGEVLWRVNGAIYTRDQLTNGTLPGHSSTETSILVNNPVNNTQYICVSASNGNLTFSDPAYITIAGEYNKISNIAAHENASLHVCKCGCI